MPLIRIDIIEGRTPAQVRKLADRIHEAVVTAFHVPPNDRYQVITEHRADHLVALDTGLGFTRSDGLVMIAVVSRPRGEQEKLAFYKHVCEGLLGAGTAPADILVHITTNQDADWSFGFGRAQFLTGELGGASRACGTPTDA
jgi:phenylpyruvate tautomerase PptA (4-oxalocrotonate tautomerase family)